MAEETTDRGGGVEEESSAKPDHIPCADGSDEKEQVEGDQMGAGNEAGKDARTEAAFLDQV